MISPSWQLRLPWVEGPAAAREGRLIYTLPTLLFLSACTLSSMHLGCIS